MCQALHTFSNCTGTHRGTGLFLWVAEKRGPRDEGVGVEMAGPSVQLGTPDYSSWRRHTSMKIAFGNPVSAPLIWVFGHLVIELCEAMEWENRAWNSPFYSLSMQVSSNMVFLISFTISCIRCPKGEAHSLLFSSWWEMLYSPSQRGIMQWNVGENRLAPPAYASAGC